MCGILYCCMAASYHAVQLSPQLGNRAREYDGVARCTGGAWKAKPSLQPRHKGRIAQGEYEGKRGEVRCVWRNLQPQPTEARLHRGSASPHSCLVPIPPAFSFPASNMLVGKPTTLPLPPSCAGGIQHVFRLICFKSCIRMDAEIVVA